MNCVSKLKNMNIAIPQDIQPDTRNNKTVEQQIIHRIRNGFAHLNIKTNERTDDVNIKTITVRNNNGNRDNFVITFTSEQLNEFCRYVAKLGLNEARKTLTNNNE